MVKLLRVNHPNMEEACRLLRSWSLEPKGHFHKDHDRSGKEREGAEGRGSREEREVSFIPRYIDWGREQVPTCLYEVHKKILVSIFPPELIANGEVLKHSQAWKKCALIGNACSKKCSCPFTTAEELHDGIDRLRAARRRVGDEDRMEEEFLQEERRKGRDRKYQFQPADCNDFLVRFKAAEDEEEESADEDAPNDSGYSMQNPFVDPYMYHRCCGITFLRKKDLVLHWERRHRDGVVPCDQGYEELGKSSRTRINMFGLGRPMVLKQAELTLSTTPPDVLVYRRDGGDGETSRQGTGGKNGKFLSSQMLEARLGPFAGLVADRLPHFLFQESEPADPDLVIR